MNNRNSLNFHALHRFQRIRIMEESRSIYCLGSRIMKYFRSQ